ncbi:hypothetical protein UQW22_04170 [Isoptericola halotolerans]|uniref:hypothetical protein n=1 Tax=Isoptericola halotolerans TaxID=300560 RepID=UPI00388F1046
MPAPAAPSDRPVLPRHRFTSPEPVDLTTAWQLEEHRATAASATHFWCDDRHGWMRRAGLDDALEPVLVPDALGASSFYRFVDLDAGVAADLMQRLPADYLARERQNDGPTIGAVLGAVVAHPDRLRAHGYVVGPGRCDERITVEGVLVRCDHEFAVGGHHSPGCQCDELYRFVVGLGVDDAAVPPHEVVPWWGWGLRDGPGGGSGPAPDGGADADHWYRLWWD